MARRPQLSWERLEGRLQEQDVIIEAHRDTEGRLRAQGSSLLGLLDSEVEERRRLDAALAQCEQEDRTTRQRAQGFCHTAVDVLDSRAQDAVAHSQQAIKSLTDILAAGGGGESAGDSGAERAEIDGAVAAAASAVEAASFELHRSLASQCGENMGAMDTVAAAHKACVVALSEEWDTAARASRATAEGLAARAKASVTSSSAWGDEALARLAASGSVVEAAQRAHTTAATAAHAALEERLEEHGQLVGTQSTNISAVASSLATHLDEMRGQSELGEAGRTAQLLQAQRTNVNAVADRVRTIDREAAAHSAVLVQYKTASADAATKVLEVAQEQRRTVSRFVDGHKAACVDARATLEDQSRVVGALATAENASRATQLAHVSELRDALRDACTQLRDNKLTNQHAANLSAAQKQQDESSSAQLDMLGAFSSGLEAAITMDLRATASAGAGEALIEDDVLEAVNTAAKQLESETAALLESLKRQAKQLGDVAQHLDVLTVSTREARQREATTSMMAELQSAQKKAQRDAIAAVTAGMEVLLKEQLTKMDESVEQKTKQAVQEQLDKLAREQQAKLDALQRAQREATELNAAIHTDITTLCVSQNSHGRTASDRTTKLGSRVRNAVKKLALLLEEVVAIEEHTQSAHTASLRCSEDLLTETAQWNEVNSATANAVESAASVVESIRAETTSYSETHSQQVAKLEEYSRNGVANLQKLEVAVQTSAESAVGSIDTMEERVARTTSEAAQLHQNLERQATEWSASLPALEQSTLAILDDTERLAEADAERLHSFLASGSDLLPCVDQLQTQHDAVSAGIKQLEELQLASRESTVKTTETWASQVADALQTEVEQVRHLIVETQKELQPVKELQQTLDEQLALGAIDAAEQMNANARAETERLVDACASSTRAWDQYRVGHKQQCEDMQSKASALQHALSQFGDKQAAQAKLSASARLEAARDTLDGIGKNAERERAESQSLAAHVQDFCLQDLRMHEPVTTHTSMLEVPQYSHELTKTPDEDTLLMELRSDRARTMAESAAATASNQAERLGQQAKTLEQKMADAEERALEAAATSQAAAVKAAMSAQKSVRAAERATTASPPDLIRDLSPSVPVPTMIEQLHSTMSPGSGTHVPAPAELFDSLRAESPPSAQARQEVDGIRSDVGQAMAKRASAGSELRDEIAASVQRELDEQHRKHEQQMRTHQEQLDRMKQQSDSMDDRAPNTVTDALFDRLDTNGDGIITRSEFTSGLQQSSSTNSQGESPQGESPSMPLLRHSEMSGMQEVDLERQRLREEIARAADAAEAAMHQTGGPMSSQIPPRREMPIHDSWLSDGAQPWIDQSSTFAGPPPHPQSKVSVDPVAAALLRVCWEAIHYRRRVLYGLPIDSLRSFYTAVETQPSVISTRLGPQLLDIREGLRQLDIGLTAAQLDRLISTMPVDGDQHSGGAVSFDTFSRWLHVRSSDAGIIEAANVATDPSLDRGWDPATAALSALSSGEGPPPTTAQLQAIAQLQLQRGEREREWDRDHGGGATRSPAKRRAGSQRARRSAAASQVAADRQRSRSPGAPNNLRRQPKSARDGSGANGRGGGNTQRRSGSAGKAVRGGGGGGKARAAQRRGHGAPELPSSPGWHQHEVDAARRVVWDAIRFKDRTLCVALPCVIRQTIARDSALCQSLTLCALASCHAMPCRLCCAVLCCAVLCCAVLC